MPTPEADETPNQRAARLRREKRQAKTIGEERLNKIKALNGGAAPPEEILTGQTQSVDDPDEVDISRTNISNTRTSYRSPAVSEFEPSLGITDSRISGADLRQRVHDAGQQPQPGDFSQQAMQNMINAFGGDKDSIHNTEDPMEMLSKLLNSANPGQPQPRQSTQSTFLWKLTHAIFAFIIAGYIAATTTFDGSLLSRTQSSFTQSDDGGLGSRLFLIFVSAELGLQSVRFYVEGGQLQGGGMIATISNIAPEPFATYVRNAGRWLGILSSIISDAMVVIFVLGVIAWWKGSMTVS